METLSEAEIQLLIVLIELAEPKETPNNNFYTFYPKSPEQAGTYFRKFRLDWSQAYDNLKAKGFLLGGEASPALTSLGREQAIRWRDARPPIYYWYREYYAEAPQSLAYARFCEKLYGRNLCQTNFSDMQQLDALLQAADLGPSSRVLDLGCGIGMIAEYISDQAGACVTGMDYIPEAIEQANERTQTKRQRLNFRVGNLDSLPFEPGSFDTLISIDTLYMPNDLDHTLRQMQNLLLPGGQMLVFYMHMLWGENVDRETLQAEKTPLGAALLRAGLTFKTQDFSAQTYAHMQRKRKIGEAMREEFTAEGRLWLNDYILTESESKSESYDPKSTNLSRYLYHVRV